MLKSAQTSLASVQITVFVTLLCVPLVGLLLRPEADRKDEAKPTAAQHTSPLAPLREQLNRRFGFRRDLIRWNGILMVRGLGVSSSERTFIGKDGWLFLARESPKAGLPVALMQARNAMPYTAEDLNETTQALQDASRRAKELGVRYLLVVAPNKETIYPEKVPAGYKPIRPESRLDQLLAHVRATTDVDMLDLRPALMAAKRDSALYYRTDTHWNAAGALVGQTVIAERLQEWFPQVKPLRLSDCTLLHRPATGGDLARMLGLEEILTDDVTTVIPPEVAPVHGLPAINGMQIQPMPEVMTTCPGAPIPSAMVYRDSFGQALAPWLSPHFQRVSYFWNASLGALDWERIRKERPTVLIHQVVERSVGSLTFLPPKQSLLPPPGATPPAQTGGGLRSAKPR